MIQNCAEKQRSYSEIIMRNFDLKGGVLFNCNNYNIVSLSKVSFSGRGNRRDDLGELESYYPINVIGDLVSVVILVLSPLRIE